LTSKIDAGLELISALGAIELKPVEIRDLLYNLILKNFDTIDEILEAAQKEKLLQRKNICPDPRSIRPYK
jgi:hypothetical protein